MTQPPNRKARAQACRSAVLDWLDEAREGTRNAVDTRKFAESTHDDKATPYTPTEIDEAINWLRDKQYVQGDLYGPGFWRIAIRTEGIDALDSGRPVGAPAPTNAGNSINITVNGNNNQVASNSPNASQVITVTMTPENSKQLLNVARLLAQNVTPASVGPDANRAQEAEEVADELREAAQQDDVPPGKLQRLLTRAKRVGISRTGEVFDQAISDAVDQALNGLGLG